MGKDGFGRTAAWPVCALANRQISGRLRPEVSDTKNEISDEIADRLKALYPDFGRKQLRKVEQRLRRAWFPRKIDGRWIWLENYVATIEKKIAVREPGFRPISARWVEEDTFVRETEIHAKLCSGIGSLSIADLSGGELSEEDKDHR